MDQYLAINSLAALAKENFTYKDFIKYYKNTFTRNVVASMIDVNTDIKNVAENPEMMKTYVSNGMEIPMKVAERLEHRKKDLAEALEILNSIKDLENLADGQIEEFITTATKEQKAAPAEEKGEAPAPEPEPTPEPGVNVN